MVHNYRRFPAVNTYSVVISDPKLYTTDPAGMYYTLYRWLLTRVDAVGSRWISLNTAQLETDSKTNLLHSFTAVIETHAIQPFAIFWAINRAKLIDMTRRLADGACYVIWVNKPVYVT